jgi:Lysine methyltransferase
LYPSTLVYLTDIKEALPLLDENVERFGAKAATDSQKSLPKVRELTWGQDLSNVDWFNDEILSTVSPDDHVLITGGEIVYRPSLFDSLLDTLNQLRRALNKYKPVQVLLSCNSCRSYLDDFWARCQERGFDVVLVGLVQRLADGYNVSHSSIPYRDKVFPPPVQDQVYIVELIWAAR